MSVDRAALDRALTALPRLYPGPGGVAGVVLDGQVIARHAWGWADPALRRPMTARTGMPICSISKQFTCAALLDAAPDPERLAPGLRDLLPALETPLPSVAHLAHNQSGLRDSWALTVLHGAQPEGRFTRADAGRLFARMRSGHFAPGTRYAYSNGNFRLLADLLERATGRGIAAHYAALFDRFGMETARLGADTAIDPDARGHEGNPATGWLPATNRIWWEGDAGIVASLDDLLAWERAIDAMRDDAGSLYARLSVPVRFADGRPAAYGWGLAHESVAGVAVTGHGGALRGWRARRLHAAAARLSVVVMFNHEANAHAAATALMRAALGAPPAAPAAPVPPGWHGAWLEPETGLLLTVDADETRFATGPEALAPDAEGLSGGAMTLRRAGDGVTLIRPAENLTGNARPVAPLPPEVAPQGDIAGRYASAETGSTLEIVAAGGGWSAGFTGFLGQGPMEPLEPVAPDLWALWTRRGMDAAAPGRWTVQLHRYADGRVAGLTVGCWLARGVGFARVG